ncbi:immunity-related GTPase family Q protein-like isoform X2 [Ambystoma mexicanum]|uniref:immunity-related GTPase family Q protein-like isoform X2 n=1 Tax=Ambystoma mexicanum TaxID=8296 RepID=UPI0037E8E3A0
MQNLEGPSCIGAGDAEDQSILKMAILGLRGSGYEELIHLLRSMPSSDLSQPASKGAAQGDSTYLSPFQLQFTLLPEVPEAESELAIYTQRLPFREHHIFILTFRTGLPPEYVRLISCIEEASRCVLLVRTGVEQDLILAKNETGALFGEETLVEEIRRACTESFVVQGVPSLQAFLVSLSDPSKFDFPDMCTFLRNGTLLHHSSGERGDCKKICQQTPTQEKGEVSILIAGKPGAGKSALITAILGLPDRDLREGVQTKSDGPVLYMNPDHPNILLWELQLSEGSANHPEKWIEEADILVLLTADQFEAAQVDQAVNVLKARKKVYFARSKVDLDLHTIKRKLKTGYCQQKVIEFMRKIGVEYLEHHGVTDPKYLLMSSYEPQKFDFPLLKEYLLQDSKTFERLKRSTQSDFEVISDKEIAEIHAAFQSGGLAGVVRLIQSSLDAILDTKLNIAVTGESGNGKSTFVNSLRGLDDEDEGAAPVGLVETTIKPTPYLSPKYQNVTIWDLPGIGTPNFKAENYLELVNFHTYDFFIILASERFKENHVMLAKEIAKQGKCFYFIRTKIDNDVNSQGKKRRKLVDTEAMLDDIRKDCEENLRKAGLPRSKVFLISSFELDKYDFQRLQEDLEAELPGYKLRAFLLSLPNISENIIQRKKVLLGQEIWKVALLASIAAVVPVPGLGFACDASLLLARLTTYRKDFDLDDLSLARLAERSGKSLHLLRSQIQSPLGKKIDWDLVVNLLHKATGSGLEVVHIFAHKVPILGTVAAGGIAFRATYAMLGQCLEDLASDSQRVLLKALETEL